MIYINGHLTIGGLVWQILGGRHSAFSGNEEGVRLAFHVSGGTRRPVRRDTIKAVMARIDDPQFKLSWITPARKEWRIDCDALRMAFSSALESEKWLTGIFEFEPEYEESEREAFGKPRYDSSIVFYLTPEILTEEIMTASLPPEIVDSIVGFRRDYPDSSKTAFIMMRFGTTAAHEQIASAIKAGLANRGGLRVARR